MTDIEEKYHQLAMLSGDTKTIRVEELYYKNERYNNRYRFSIAHELGHWYLHANYFKKASDYNIKG